mmetsp:Transcript_2188/g.3320  ORF Transcript_2188/g.3320 Transcript_2188/m.3320 type:complete len:154 (-) Transcript_2188:54-515(-)|eukprot:CAMPEP_0201717518 /NCGR_PEP_ID=MMETSP0593-20130828/3236_1 /ASSEMBLY_ACC=CAM_ASM_000672 /TAXON_ID=267983 /ORGANISM="Skeletonema japonicum, Strain CCMP2506" /LENGTH=153 /DNA_ID=CAMNT_0048207591 /DNA_START=80 /DNA_END=541 /DNA_ORIENTATION=+
MDPPPPRRRSPRNLSSSNGSFSTQGKTANKNNDSSNAATETKLKIKIKRYHGVAKWTWGVSGFNNDDDDDEDEVCIICQTAFEGCAPGVKYPGDESPVVFGKCKHAFHLQCVSTWLQSQNSNNPTCPTCRQEWEFGAERTVDDDVEREESVEV